MRRFWRDLRYGARGLRNQPGFAAIAILTLALGIGAATTIFSVIYNVLLDPFPYTDAKRVVAIQIHDLASSRPGGPAVPANRGVPGLPRAEPRLRGSHRGNVPGRLCRVRPRARSSSTGGSVTPNMFRFLGVPAMLGRTLLPDDARAGRAAGLRDELQAVGQALQPGPVDSSARRSCSTASPPRWWASCRRGSPSWERTCGSPSR